MLRDTLARFKKMLDPAHKDVLNLLKDLAGLLTVVGKLAEAEALYLEVLEANPQSQTALRNLESLLALPALTPLMADAHANPAPWRYTVAEPATNWLKADFPDDRWPMGSAVFGTPDCLPRTLWTNSDIWLRREFTLAEVPAGLIFLCLRHNSAVHDDDARIFLNGLEAAHESGAIEEYALLPLSPAARAALKSGRNVAAVHCRATNRLNFKCIDVGLYLTPDLQIGKKRLIERLGQAIQDQPQSTNLLRLRADLLARLGRWQEAAGDLRKVIELDPSDQWDWYRSAVLLLQIGDVPACRIHCQRMVDRFGADTNAAVLERTAKACLAVPGGRADLNTVSQLAEKAVNLGTNQILSYHFEFTKSLAAYRRGQFAQAAQGIRQVIGQPGDVGGTSEDYFGEICANAVLAMALHQMKQPEEARATLAQAVKIADTRLAKLDDGDLGGSWYDWLTAHILLREAKELIEKK
jgi:tetratricopeptide (TPR) repeat protein